MDETPKSIKSNYFDKESFQKQIEIIKEVAQKAEDIINYESAHDPELLRAINIVEEFLRKKHRLCYGGQAINAHMPKKYKIYDSEKTVPDYDFFTPDQESDIATLTQMLRKAGFVEISAREGVHEGTIKIYVNFNAIADITKLDPKLYKLLSKKEFKSDGISYLDADTLRMMMYLELSRPKGMVTRWEKVYERLMLLNEFVPIQKCDTGMKGNLTTEEVNTILRKIIAEKKIFAGGELVGYYRTALKKGKRPHATWLLGTDKPILFYSQTPEADAKDLTDIGLHFKKMNNVGDVLPTTYIAMRRGQPAVIIIEETACHSYYNIPLRFTEVLRVASIDTLITLYFSMSLLESKLSGFSALECAAQELVEISFRARAKPAEFPFPFISLKCSGHQKSLPSLIREKVKRMASVKRKIKEAVKEEAIEAQEARISKELRNTRKRRHV